MSPGFEFVFHINGDMSARAISILKEMAEGQENYSIDKSFLDVSGRAAYVPLEELRRQMINWLKRTRACHRRQV